MLKDLLKVFVVAIFAVTVAVSQSPVITGVPASTADTDSMIVIPFTNKASNSDSELPEIGESFAETLSDLLSNKGITVLSNQERKFVQQGALAAQISVPSS